MTMLKLSKADNKKIMAAIRRTEEPGAALIGAVAAYNEALGPLRSLIRAIGTEWQAAWDVRSERWHESVMGQSAAATITEWDALADDLDDIQVELPEIELPGSAAEAISVVNSLHRKQTRA